MHRTATILAAAVLLLGACKSSTGSDSGSDEDTFRSNSLNRYAQYSDGSAHWSVKDGALVGTGPGIQAVLIRNGVQMTDGWVETVTSRADDGGLVLRFQDPNHYYLLAFRDDNSAFPFALDKQNLAVYHHVGSEYDEMWSHSVHWPRGAPHTIRFEAQGNKLRVYFDGVLQVELTPSPAINDPAPYAGAGGVGLRYYGDDALWITQFDTFRWHAVL